ncbi:MAG: molybdate ABC transporter substrate-binding protein [Lachnospiraceae bacterium]|nr:molybdate ABC transporter substrate-binding protein [Lachnospiraceae bacterium]MCI1657520.1 molybdate ABC transporter substrate-binding protein [Lachnospiraceae bacterium]MCI2195935.1 molybdate ABC transporter substrate-binding protein [Lachnospiraceae bacterium]
MKMKVLSIALVAAMGAAVLAGCGSSKMDTKQTSGGSAAAEETSAAGESGDQKQAATIHVFAAASLNKVLDELIADYNKTQPDVKVQASYDSSGTLLTQIEEGAACDVFFSAAQKQMDQLQDKDKMVVEGTRHNVVNNQVCVVTQKDSKTKVTGLKTLKDAKSIALADGSVPVGKYTRQALVNAGILKKADDVSAITTEQVSKALDGVEINECKNVSAVTSAVAEGSNEVGTVYKSDTYGLEDKLKILEVVSYDLTGDVIYPIAQVQNKEADEAESSAAADFVKYVSSDQAKKVFRKYYFDTDVKD